MFNLAGVGNTLQIIIEWAIYLTILAVVVIYFIRKMSFKHDIVIIAKRGGGAGAIGYDKGRIVRKNGVSRLVFSSWLRRKVSLPEPKPELIYPGAKGRSTIFLYRYGDRIYTPVLIKRKDSKTKLTSEEVRLNELAKLDPNYLQVDITEVISQGDILGLEPIPSHVEEFYMERLKAIANKYHKQTAMQIYGPQIIMIFAILGGVAIMWLVLRKADVISTAFAQGVAGAKVVSAGQNVGGFVPG